MNVHGPGLEIEVGTLQCEDLPAAQPAPSCQEHSGRRQTENIRRQLVEIGIKPLESRKAALFQLAADMPAPILAELLGTTDKNAANWARLAARDWTRYIADRAN